MKLGLPANNTPKTLRRELKNKSGHQLRSS